MPAKSARWDLIRLARIGVRRSDSVRNPVATRGASKAWHETTTTRTSAKRCRSNEPWSYFVTVVLRPIDESSGHRRRGPDRNAACSEVGRRRYTATKTNLGRVHPATCQTARARYSEGQGANLVKVLQITERTRENRTDRSTRTDRPGKSATMVGKRVILGGVHLGRSPLDTGDHGPPSLTR